MISEEIMNIINSLSNEQRIKSSIEKAEIILFFLKRDRAIFIVESCRSLVGIFVKEYGEKNYGLLNQKIKSIPSKVEMDLFSRENKWEDNTMFIESILDNCNIMYTEILAMKNLMPNETLFLNHEMSFDQIVANVRNLLEHIQSILIK